MLTFEFRKLKVISYLSVIINNETKIKSKITLFHIFAQIHYSLRLHISHAVKEIRFAAYNP